MGRKRRPRRRASRARQFVALLAVAAVGGYAGRSWLADHALLIIGAAAALLLLLLAVLWRKGRLASSLKEIDAMGGHEFERFLVRLFRRNGYRASAVGAGGGDFGADLIIEKAGVRIAVQAKNYTQGAVGNDAVQQAIAGATFYDCDQAMVVTNARFTRAARLQAEGCSRFAVTLWDRDAIARLLRS